MSQVGRHRLAFAHGWAPGLPGRTGPSVDDTHCRTLVLLAVHPSVYISSHGGPHLAITAFTRYLLAFLCHSHQTNQLQALSPCPPNSNPFPLSKSPPSSNRLRPQLKVPRLLPPRAAAKEQLLAPRPSAQQSSKRKVPKKLLQMVRPTKERLATTSLETTTCDEQPMPPDAIHLAWSKTALARIPS